MRAVVVEIKGKQAAVLKTDGTFEKIPNKGYQVGDTIETDNNSGRIIAFSNRATRLIAAAAAVLLLVSGGVGYNTMAVQAYSYVSVDVNPSIEYAVNRLNRIVDVEALNEDAASIVSELKAEGIKNKTLSEAMEMTGDLLNDSGYISEEKDYFLVNVTAGDEKHKAVLEKEAQAASKKFKRGDDVFEISESTREERKTAREHNMSAGRFKEAKRIYEASGEQDGMSEESLEEFRNAPVRELFEKSGRVPGEMRSSETESIPPAGQGMLDGGINPEPPAGQGMQNSGINPEPSAGQGMQNGGMNPELPAAPDS